MSAHGDTFATQLRRLFDTVSRADGTRFTPREVAEEVTQRGHKVSRGYLYDLLRGKSEPSHALVRALADFFQVPLDYFSDSERGRELNQQYELLAALGDNAVRKIAHRARGLSRGQLSRVIAYIDFEKQRGDAVDDDT
ncbi:helix-turn-helix domain-containing protein [Streptoalloteichus hindustanus]|uniref:helix-turn-helix domain-containing protein n=1 Tax=Streptoalloteichus hindustanus TaxID=2017 RepID=UPI001F34F8E2|nr:helix-turn-helix transcriptional regulator [Streptoalloteichus hindustanus]